MGGVRHLEISFRSKKIERICTDYTEASRQHGREMAIAIHKRMNELRAADSVDMMIRFKIGRCHQLAGDRIGQFSLDLQQPYRLVFKSSGEAAVLIFEIVDYH